MRVSKKRLKKIIREERHRLLMEITPGEAGIAAMGGGTPADQGIAAAQMDAYREAERAGKDEITVTHDWRDGIEQFIYDNLAASGEDMEDEGRYIVKALEMIRRDIQDEMRGDTR